MELMEDLSLSDDDHILLSFPPQLRKNIAEIWKNGKIGISSANMKIRTTPPKNLIELYRKTYTDSFVLEIPYAGKQLSWEIIFKEEDFDYAPDFDFSDEFLCDPDVNTISDYIPSLGNWDVNNPKSLVSVIREFMTLYKEFQVSKLQTDNKFSRLYAEYEVLKSELKNFENDVEVFVDNNDAVHFLIGINVKFSCLPSYIQPILFGTKVLNPNEDTAALRVSFVKPDCSKVQTDLQLSPRLTKVLGKSGVLHIPCYKKDSGLSNYIAEVTSLLEERVECVANHYRLRNEYISFLLTLCGCNIIEYDNVLFSKATLLLNSGNFPAVVHIAIAKKFPQEKPKVMLRSACHLQNGKPVERNLDNYPYSPRWEPEEMIKRLLKNLQEEISKFQNVSGKS